MTMHDRHTQMKSRSKIGLVWVKEHVEVISFIIFYSPEERL